MFTFTIQFRQKGERAWTQDNNFQPSNTRQELALKVQELAKANPNYSFRLLTARVPDVNA